MIPGTFSELLTPAGMGAVVVLIVALLKKLKGPPEFFQVLGDWIRANPTVVSVIVTATVYLFVQIVVKFGYLEEADSIWVQMIWIWTVSQGIYATQKAATRTTRSLLRE